MNQILQVQETKKNNKSIDTKKIVLFFAICLAIFGVILLGQGAYWVYENMQNEKVTKPTPGDNPDQDVPEYIPTIILTKTQDDKVIINVQSKIAISHIIYNWNNEAANTIEQTGKTNIEEIIEIPVGENVLNLSVIDSNGKETKKQETYIVKVLKPVIELSVVGNDIKISVTSEEDLSYVTYKWNTEQEKKQEMATFENKRKYEKQLEIPKGQNTLKIVAVDIKGNKTEKSQEIKGVAKLKDPNVYAEGEFLYFTFEAEENMSTVEFTFNGKTYLMNENTFGNTKIVQYKVKMIPGMNYLKLIGTTESGVKNTTVWKREYKVQ